MMTRKNRISIAEEIASEILYLSDRTCCVCTIRGKRIQIHHIDEDPANNVIENLAVLCFDCHDETMIKGGFGRKLKATEVLKNKSEWIQRVNDRRKKADDLASIGAVTGQGEISDDHLDYKTQNDSHLLNQYLNKILIIHKAQLMIAQTNWDSGVTAVMNLGSSDMIDFYQEVLLELATFYIKGHFDGKPPKVFFSEYISSRFLWHRLILEPEGLGTGGTIISTMIGGSVMGDCKIMILDMVRSLTSSYNTDDKFDFLKWKSEWVEENA